MNHSNFNLLAFFMILALGFSSCQPSNGDKDVQHFISDVQYRNVVEQEFQNVKQLTEHRNTQLYDVFNQSLSLEEKEALEFLFAFMPLNDLANNDGDFYLKNLRLAFASRDTFSWGQNIPKDVFRHFVLPYRINNEDSDSSRSVFFYELYPRVKDMTIDEAALEVNHWCHEKVNYHGTNIRTMAPLGVIRTGYGRCGEESTFTVTALRSVGIPARQVYTPRWAHADDNHAWVEVFIDGAWKFLGACEPKAELNIAWFDAPVQRAMMVHTKAFGQYYGSEKVLDAFGKYSVLNLLSNYVAVKDVFVKIIDQNNKPLEYINVEFGLYNYAEFFPLKNSKTDQNGLAFLSTANGDLRIFASDDTGRFAVQKITVENTDTLVMTLNQNVGDEFSLDFDNVPPIGKAIKSSDVGETKENDLRFQYEDSVRNQFIASFYDEEKAKELASSLGFDANRLVPIMIKARGNYTSIENYLKEAKSTFILDLLESIAEKDLHDVSTSILMDHLNNYKPLNTDKSDAFNFKYILNPRVLNEKLTAYRSFLKENFKDLKGNTAQDLSTNLISWIKENIKINSDLNYYKIALSPKGLYELRVSDAKSRDMFFVAVLRSLGIPARIEQATLSPQYFDKQWINVSFESTEVQFSSAKADITFLKPNDLIIEPQYRIHFGLAKYIDQQFVTLEYDWEKKLSDFDRKMEIEPGYYQLTTGNRLPNGTVLVHHEYFNINEGEAIDVPIIIRKNSEAPEVIAKWVHAKVEGEFTIYGWIDPSTEPGHHFLNDLKPFESKFDTELTPLQLFCESATEKEGLKKVTDLFNVQLDPNLEVLKAMYKSTGLAEDIDLPVFIVVKKNGDVLFHCSGYNIGTPEQLLKLTERIQ